MTFDLLKTSNGPTTSVREDSEPLRGACMSWRSELGPGAHLESHPGPAAVASGLRIPTDVTRPQCWEQDGTRESVPPPDGRGDVLWAPAGIRRAPSSLKSWLCRPTFCSRAGSFPTTTRCAGSSALLVGRPRAAQLSGVGFGGCGLDPVRRFGADARGATSCAGGTGLASPGPRGRKAGVVARGPR